MNEGQANSGICDMNARYNHRMEGYTIGMSYAKEFKKIKKGIDLFWNIFFRLCLKIKLKFFKNKIIYSLVNFG